MRDVISGAITKAAQDLQKSMNAIKKSKKGAKRGY